MPKRQSALDTLVAEGMSVYPAGMSGIAAPRSWTSGMGAPRVTFHRVRSGKVWGGMGGLGNVNKEQATKRLLDWIKTDNPRAYASIMRRLRSRARAPRGLGQLEPVTVTAQRITAPATTTETAPESQTWWQKALTTVAQIAPQYYAAKQQKELLDINVERAARGDPPIDSSQYGAAVRVGVDPATIRATAQETVGAVMSSPVVWIVGGAIAYTLLRGRGGRRRR